MSVGQQLAQTGNNVFLLSLLLTLTDTDLSFASSGVLTERSYYDVRLAEPKSLLPAAAGLVRSARALRLVGATVKVRIDFRVIAVIGTNRRHRHRGQQHRALTVCRSFVGW